ncbi:MAG: acyl-CoA thioesterase [Deltaproteobacteria bacterium]|nr:acyl-CoA thioesterase [Deltaproteobacteria bacterium]
MDNYRFYLPGYGVRAADINAGGHVSATAVLNYFHDARIAYLERLGAFSESDIGDGHGLILAETRVRHRAEMFLGDVLELGVRINQMRSRSFVMGYRVERAGTATAEGTISVVCFDYRQRRPAPVPAAFREAAERFEGASFR